MYVCVERLNHAAISKREIRFLLHTAGLRFAVGIIIVYLLIVHFSWKPEVWKS